MGEHGLRNVLLQKDWEVSEAYRVGGTPSAVLVRPDGTIGSAVVGGAEAIEALVAHAVGEHTHQLPMHHPKPKGSRVLTLARSTPLLPPSLRPAKSASPPQ